MRAVGFMISAAVYMAHMQPPNVRMFLVYFHAVILGVLIDRVSKGRSLIWLAVVSICAFGYYRYVILFDGGHFLTYHSWLFDPFYTFFQ